MKSVSRAASVLLVATLLAGAAMTARADSTTAATTPDTARENIVLRTNLIAAGIIAAWGAANWDYGDNRWQTTDEGWFGQHTKEGGADKAGHFYTTYVLGRGLTGIYRAKGLESRYAASAGALSSLAAMTFMEFGDGFSPYGFAKEDQTMNVVGAGLSWLLATRPAIDRRFAFRAEYRLHPDHLGDFVTDYERWRYFFVLKPDGFDALPSPLRWIELHAGFAARGYADNDPLNDRRLAYFGVGISLTKLAREAGWRKTGVFLDYVQLPGTVAAESNAR